MKTNLYIDGFNFYFSSVRRSQHLWLDFTKLFKLVMPDDELNRTRYFTALVKAERNDQESRAVSSLTSARSSPPA